ncbi:helical backbone metal receptor [Rhodohalobacter sp. 8-1]|uniref:helical backbone metal receptor n=1 Tax=Rhodohalobacter sp. 8-1 TaxID=3131972 RepID=UPI0030EF79F7
MNYPKSIVCLVPSLTELLFDLGLGDRLAGRTRFCIHPEGKVENVPIVGGTKNPRLDKIFEIKPELVIANHEENQKEDIEELAGSLDVMVTDIKTIEDALLTIYDIGKRCGVAAEADALIKKIRTEMNNVPAEPQQSAAYFIWREPWMTIGHDTYIHSVLTHWNLENVYGEQTRYPKTSLIELAKKNPELILLSSEPYPFKEKHRDEVEAACPDSRVLMVNGEWFSWYGSRMLIAFRRLNSFRKAIS